MLRYFKHLWETFRSKFTTRARHSIIVIGPLYCVCPNINCHVSSAGGEVGLIKLKPVSFFHHCSTFLLLVSSVGVSFYMCSCFLSTTCRNKQLCMCLLVIALFYTLLFWDFTKMQCGVLSIRKVFVCLIRLTQAKSNSPSKDFCFLNERCNCEHWRLPSSTLNPPTITSELQFKQAGFCVTVSCGAQPASQGASRSPL